MMLTEQHEDSSHRELIQKTAYSYFKSAELILKACLGLICFAFSGFLCMTLLLALCIILVLC